MPYQADRDAYASVATGQSTPARFITAVTPSDSTDLTLYAKALRISVPDATSNPTIRVTPVEAVSDSDTVTLPLPAGVTIEPLSVRRVWATGTSAGLTIHAYVR